MAANTLLPQAIFTLLFALVLVGWFARPATDPKEVAAWARGHDLELTARNHPMVTYYVRLAITLRVIGGVGGLVLGSLFDGATGLDTSAGAGFWIWVVLGWLLGASWAEYRLTRPSSGERAASLTPRQVGDYLSSHLSAAPWVAAAVAATLAVGGLLAPEPGGTEPSAPPRLALVIAAAAAPIIAALVTAAVRAVVARRQPIGPADVVSADDAIRASAVHHLAGGGTAAILLIAGQLSLSVLSPHQLPWGVAGWVSALLFLGAVVAWRWFGYRRWRVRRQPDATPVLQ